MNVLLVNYIVRYLCQKLWKLYYHSTKASNREIIIKKECHSFMKQIFKVCENGYKLLYHSIFLEMCKSCKIEPKGLYMKEDFCVGNPSTKLSYNWFKENLEYQLRLCDLLIQEIKKSQKQMKSKKLL